VDAPSEGHRVRRSGGPGGRFISSDAAEKDVVRRLIERERPCGRTTNKREPFVAIPSSMFLQRAREKSHIRDHLRFIRG
jgi:hypothetical protein